LADFAEIIPSERLSGLTRLGAYERVKHLLAEPERDPEVGATVDFPKGELDLREDTRLDNAIASRAIPTDAS
jgi:hypothetical protein